MKKTALTLMLLALSTVANAAYKDGVYEGVGKGNASEITVQVTVQNGRVANVKVVKHGETDMLIGAAEKSIAKKVVKANGTEGVDVVTGASNSSKGILGGIKMALTKAQ